MTEMISAIQRLKMSTDVWRNISLDANECTENLE